MSLAQANMDIEIKRSKEEQKEEDELAFAQLKEELENSNLEMVSKLNEAIANTENVKRDYDSQIVALKEESDKNLELITNELEKEIEENRVLQAELNSMREIANMEQVKDFTNRDDFIELEEEKAAFERFFIRTWKETKKRIRTDTFKRIMAEEGSRKRKKELGNAKVER